MDVRDATNGRFSLELGEEGRSPLINKPKAPGIFLDMAKQIHELENSVCTAARRKHGEEATEIRNDPERRTLRLEAMLPEDMKLSIDRFNDIKDENENVIGKELKPKLRLLDVVFARDGNGNDVAQTVPFLHWKLLVVGSERLEEVRPKATKNDMLADAINRWGNVKAVPDANMSG